MPQSPVQNWFKDHFTKLHPLLQKLHINGGTLEGEIDIIYAKGIAGMLGRVLAGKLNLPDHGKHDFMVRITHTPESMSWERCFNGRVYMTSVFMPVGTIDDGYWVEQTGRIQIRLAVDIQDGGWYWRTLGFRLFGLPLPQWLFPKVTAYKRIEGDQYRFYVGFSLPFLGEQFSYSGILEAHNTHT